MARFLLTLQIWAVFLCLFCAGGAHASTLTEQSVRAFIMEVSRLAGTQGQKANPEEIRRFLNAHIEDDARFKSSAVYIVPGFPSETKTLSLNKADYIDSFLKGRADIQDYSYAVDIKSITITPDGNKALVKTRSTEGGLMKVQSAEGAQNVEMIGQSDCDQVLTLRDTDIQMFSAACQTAIEFLQK